jgi:hypothetical protein
MVKKIFIDDAFAIATEKGGLSGLDKTSFKVNNSTTSKLPKKEKRTELLQITLTPSEKKAFLSLIGKDTGSDIGRLLIQEFIKNNS